MGAHAIGGSQPGAPLVYGPFSVDYTDILADNASVDLFTPSIGDVVLGWWVDPDTYDAFDGDTLLGQGTAWAADAATRSTIYADASGGNGASHGALGQPAHGSDAGAIDSEISTYPGVYGVRYPIDGIKARSAIAVVSTAGPVQIANVCGSSLASGHLDIYFLVATPTTP